MSEAFTFNSKQIAAKFGVSPWTIQMWRRLGLRFDLGNRTTLENVMRWRMAHPDLKTTEGRFQSMKDRPEWMAERSAAHARTAAGGRPKKTTSKPQETSPARGDTGADDLTSS